MIPEDMADEKPLSQTLNIWNTLIHRKQQHETNNRNPEKRML